MPDCGGGGKQPARPCGARGTDARARVSGDDGRPCASIERTDRRGPEREGGMIDRLTGLSLTALVPSLVVIALAGADPSHAVDPATAPEATPAATPMARPSAPSTDRPPAVATALTLDESALAQIAPALPQIINLASLDPQLASELVPDAWLDSAIESARLVAAEQPRAKPGPLAPAEWPVGPWSNAGSMTTAIRDLDPAAAAALFGALRPRIAGRCAAGGGTAGSCFQAMRVSLERLGSPVVAARLAGRDADPITDSQLEFARLGREVVNVGRAKIAAVHRAVWPPAR